MSLMWRKFREVRDGGISGSKVSRQSPPGNSGHGSQTQPQVDAARESLSLIPTAIEKLFFPNLCCDMEDPLICLPQYVTTLQQALHHHTTRRYFFSFMQDRPNQVLALFWLDVHNLRTCSSEMTSTNSAQENVDSSSNRQHRPQLSNQNTCLDDRPDNNTKNSGMSNPNTLDDSNNANLNEDTIQNTDAKFSGTNCNNRCTCDNFRNVRTEQTNCDNSTDSINPKICSSCSSSKYNNNLSTESSIEDDFGDFQSSVALDNTRLEADHLSNVINGNYNPEDEERLSGPPCNNVREDDSGATDNSRSAASSAACPLRQQLVKEVWRIYERYVAVDADMPCTKLSDISRKHITKKINRLHAQCDTECFTTAQQEAFEILERDELPAFLSSVYHLQHQLDLLSYSAVTLPDVLHSHISAPYFMEFLEQQNARPLMEFWLAVSNFRNQLMRESAATPRDGSSHDEPCGASIAQDDAMVLYDKYFSLQAPQPLGVSADLRCALESNICREGGPLHTCYDAPLRAVLYTLHALHLPSFLQSAHYHAYTTHLLTTVRGNSNTGGRRRTLSGSTSSSTDTNNTLLAVDTARHKQHTDSAVTNMRIDNTLLTDPDSIWRRKHFNSLSCGSMSPLGRFQSDLTGELSLPGADAGGSRISRTIRRLANAKEDKICCGIDGGGSQ